jgi:hypothetical protein
MALRPLVVDLPEQGLVTGTSPVTKVFALDYALPWHAVVENSSGGDLTAIRVRFRTFEKGPWSPWEVVSSGLPIAAGHTISLAETDRPAQAIEVEFTAASTGVAVLWLVGV